LRMAHLPFAVAGLPACRRATWNILRKAVMAFDAWSVKGLTALWDRSEMLPGGRGAAAEVATKGYP
jgi:hypothetical protein